MLLFKLVLMLDEFVLLLEMLLILRFKHSLVLMLLLLDQLLLLFKVLGLTCVLIMSDMSLVLIDLLVEISMDLFPEHSHMFLNSFFNLLIDEECHSFSEIMGDLL